MRTPLDKTLRGKLEKTVEKARDTVEVAVTEALTRLGVNDGSAPSYLSEAERKLRNRLRAHGRQLGDVLNRDTGKQETELLVNEMAYEHWHRMLFARFLEQSDLLMYDQNTHVTLDECFELAEEEPDVKDGWELAGQLAQKMLPQIFRADSPVFEVKLSINHVNDLEELIATLDKKTFQASDALGWCYQFWQNKKKKQVNESGVKIGAKELSPVTQLFTEPYMVSFLLDNALGAWWAKRRLTQDDLATATNEQELRELASIPGVPLEYLRFIKDEDSGVWNSAAGDFDKWPNDLSEFKTLDPCCGSGHFLVAKFLMLVPIRMELEGLTAKQAIDKVLAQNIHGLELDQRCVELAAFALALEAWRYPNSGGYRVLPDLQLACSGISINEAKKEWKDLPNDDKELQLAISWIEEVFNDSSTLGSLVNPDAFIDEAHIHTKSLQLLVQRVSKETQVTVQGLVKAAIILSEDYDLIPTNPPYLTSIKHADDLKLGLEKFYKGSHKEIATSFVERFLSKKSTVCYVMPQNWLYLNGYKPFRRNILIDARLSLAVGLGENSFISSGASGANVGLFIFEGAPSESDILVSDLTNIDKSALERVLKSSDFQSIPISACLNDEKLKIPYANKSNSYTKLNEFCEGKLGVVTGDTDKWKKCFWEVKTITERWHYSQSTVSNSEFYGGKEFIIDWSSSGKTMHRPGLGNPSWDKTGIAVSQMGLFPISLYSGHKYDNNTAAITPIKAVSIEALFEYGRSQEFCNEIKRIDKSRKVNNKTILSVPFDKEKWEHIAKSKYPNGLPKPFSNILNQWIFHGNPCASVIWNEETKTTGISELREDDTVLQVAVARLLGYRWPAERDTEMELAPEMCEIIAQNNVFDGLVDDDGIVCIPAIRGEKPAVDRLEAILHAAYGDKWSATVLNNLLKSVKSRDLNIWLRDKFFEQHCKLFQHRPFIWHVWDGHPDGFSALVNYHQLDYKGLERLIYTYLDDWISTQIQLEKDGDEGAEIRLAAARNLRKQLEEILVGDSLPGQGGLDIFVRWKSLAEQPIGWNPDLNDGVRLNIRPFMKAKDVGKKEAGILRSKPNIHWKKDRGTDVESAPWYDLGLEYGGKQGDRINDHHLTLAEKTAARDKV
ncbi:Eco57I restriction-modification methylase domain-containing protein [Pseudoalteromonas nigrifaciens]|uniref:Eco57I restriction-modification methylase domain-containing protein n=1 Tax=Pseudoalteromonas nigrifaciens TaxID=28109 RepID=UPI003FCF0D4D